MGKLIFSIFLVLIVGIIINLLIPEHFIIKNVIFILLCQTIELNSEADSD